MLHFSAIGPLFAFINPLQCWESTSPYLLIIFALAFTLSWWWWGQTTTSFDDFGCCHWSVVSLHSLPHHRTNQHMQGFWGYETGCKQMIKATLIRVIEYPELRPKRIMEYNSWLQTELPKIQTLCLKTLSKRFLNSGSLRLWPPVTREPVLCSTKNVWKEVEKLYFPSGLLLSAVSRYRMIQVTSQRAFRLETKVGFVLVSM